MDRRSFEELAVVGKSEPSFSPLIKARAVSTREVYIIKAISKAQLTLKENLIELVRRERAILGMMTSPRHIG